MMNEISLQTWKRLLDEVMTPTQKKRQDKEQLANRVKNIATDLYLSGQEFEANVLYEAAETIRGME